MAAEAAGAGSDLVQVVALLAAGVIAVPIFRRAGLGSILGYLAAGVVIGPFGLAFFSDAAATLHVAELGVVMFLFIIGLEMQPSRLWGLRREIFGLGAAQVGTCALLLTGVGLLMGLSGPQAFVAGAGFVLTSTAIVMQLLEERGDIGSPKGQRMVSILLLEDLAIVPLLAFVAFLAPGGGEEATWLDRVRDIGIGLGAIVGLIVAGRYLLNPLFRILADSHAREVMTAAALLVVLGAGTLMAATGMSMALGAFLAGVMLSESNFRHELEANIDAFRGLLIALFFMGVGMSMNLGVVLANAPLLIAGTLLVTVVKAVSVWAVFRVSDGTRADAVRSASVLTPAGEFSFVLFPLALGLGLINARQGDMLAACAAMTMLLGPPVALIGERLARRLERRPADPPKEDFSDAHGSVLVVGFGRFGQIASQCLLAQGLEVTIIDNDVEMIQSAGRFGFRIYYGDGTRLDVLRAAGAERAQVVAICVDRRDTADRIVAIMQANMPGVRLHVRAYDRNHSVALRTQGVDYEIRETFESALSFGEATLRANGIDAATAQATVTDVRQRDLERLSRQLAEGEDRGPIPIEPEPLVPPERSARPLNPEAEDVLKHETEFSS